METPPLNIDEIDRLVEDVVTNESHTVYTTNYQHRPLLSLVWFPCCWGKFGWYSFGILFAGLSWRAWAIQVSMWRFTFLFVQGRR